jgi:protein-tyrosine-phosphatase
MRSKLVCLSLIIRSNMAEQLLNEHHSIFLDVTGIYGMALHQTHLLFSASVQDHYYFIRHSIAPRQTDISLTVGQKLRASVRRLEVMLQTAVR